MPLTVILGYIHSNDKPIFEVIKIKPEGLFFHSLKFQDIQGIIDYFKNNSQ